jgi:hypothetical protein
MGASGSWTGTQKYAIVDFTTIRSEVQEYTEMGAKNMRLSADQERMLSKIRGAKEDYDEDVAELQRQLDEQKEQAKTRLRELISEARDMDIPVRQIHQKGMGFADANSLVKFLEAKPERYSVKMRRLTTNVEPTLAGTKAGATRPLKLEPTGHPNVFSITDRVGDDWVIGTMGGPHNAMPYTFIEGWEAFEGSDSGRDIYDAVVAYFDKLDYLGPLRGIEKYRPAEWDNE